MKITIIALPPGEEEEIIFRCHMLTSYADRGNETTYIQIRTWGHEAYRL